MEPATAGTAASTRLIHGASPEQWQFFAFAFAALAVLADALLDALPPWNSTMVRVSRHVVDVLPWMSREWAKVIAIALLGYFTLFNRPTKRLLVRVLATIKPLDIR